MTTFFRAARLLSLAAWVGGIFFFAFAVARIAFSVLPDAHTAGSVVRGALIALHHLGFVAGAVYLVATLTLIATQRDGHIARAVEVLIILVMLSLTGYSHFSVIPRMETDRLSLGGDIAKADPTLPAAHHFNRLHGLSVKLESGVLLCGIALLCLAPVPNRTPLDSLYA